MGSSLPAPFMHIQINLGGKGSYCFCKEQKPFTTMSQPIGNEMLSSTLAHFAKPEDKSIRYNLKAGQINVVNVKETKSKPFAANPKFQKRRQQSNINLNIIKRG